jgi:RNA polymerase sigma factor (sigma-70 family)
MTDITQWQEQVKLAVNKYARNAPHDKKQDLTQECYLKILENQEAVADARNPKWFVLTLCRNLVFDSVRGSANQRKEISLSDPGSRIFDKHSRNSIGHRMLFEETNQFTKIDGFGVSAEDLDEAIKSLPPDQQYVLRCSFFLGRTEKEIMRDLGKSQATVRRIRQAAFAKLRELLEVGDAD